MNNVKLFLSIAFVMSFSLILAQPFFVDSEPVGNGYTLKLDHERGYWKKIYPDGNEERVPVPTNIEFSEEEALRLIEGEEVMKVKRSAGYFSWTLKYPFLRTYLMESRTLYRIRNGDIVRTSLQKRPVWCCPYVSIILLIFVGIAILITATSITASQASMSFALATISYLAGMSNHSSISYLLLFAGVAAVIVGVFIENIHVAATAFLSLISGVLSLRTAEDHTGPLIAILCLFGTLLVFKILSRRSPDVRPQSKALQEG